MTLREMLAQFERWAQLSAELSRTWSKEGDHTNRAHCEGQRAGYQHAAECLRHYLAQCDEEAM